MPINTLKKLGVIISCVVAILAVESLYLRSGITRGSRNQIPHVVLAAARPMQGRVATGVAA
jgi:hypothetical protein